MIARQQIEGGVLCLAAFLGVLLWCCLTFRQDEPMGRVNYLLAGLAATGALLLLSGGMAHA